jgi:hypothetical protein
VRASPPSARYRLRKFVRRHRAGLLTTAAAALLLLVAAVGLGWTLWDRALRRSDLDHGVDKSLLRVGDLRQQYRWKEARAVLRETADRVGENGPADLRQRVKTAEDYLNIVGVEGSHRQPESLGRQPHSGRCQSAGGPLLGNRHLQKPPRVRDHIHQSSRLRLRRLPLHFCCQGLSATQAPFFALAATKRMRGHSLSPQVQWDGVFSTRLSTVRHRTRRHGTTEHWCRAVHSCTVRG